MNIKCRTRLCKGEVVRLEKWKQSIYSEVAAAECRECGATYWLFKRGSKVGIKDRILADFDERSENRPNGNKQRGRAA